MLITLTGSAILVKIKTELGNLAEHGKNVAKREQLILLSERPTQ